MKAFPPEVIAELKTYVYRLIGPRNGETFYVAQPDDWSLKTNYRLPNEQSGYSLKHRL